MRYLLACIVAVMLCGCGKNDTPLRTAELTILYPDTTITYTVHEYESIVGVNLGKFVVGNGNGFKAATIHYARIDSTNMRIQWPATVPYRLVENADR